MIPGWLHTLSIVSLLTGAVCAVLIAVDLVQRPQKMWIMNVVWPVSATFGSILSLIAYLRWGRAPKASADSGEEDTSEDTPFPVATGKGALHCGAGCALGDIAAEWLAFSVPTIAIALGYESLFSEKIFAIWILDYVFAFIFGVAFQYLTIKPMRDLSPVKGLIAAVKADAASLTSWQVGMYGFMAIAHFWIFKSLLGAELEVNTPEFWFMMQIAMLAGFASAYPVNWWLIRTGIKEKM